jgi:hypothetical protein
MFSLTKIYPVLMYAQEGSRTIEGLVLRAQSTIPGSRGRRQARPPAWSAPSGLDLFCPSRSRRQTARGRPASLASCSWVSRRRLRNSRRRLPTSAIRAGFARATANAIWWVFASFPAGSLCSVCAAPQAIVFGTHPAHVGFAGIEFGWDIGSL